MARIDSYKEKLNNYYQSFKEQATQNAIARRLSAVFERQQAVTSLNMGNLPFAPKQITPIINPSFRGIPASVSDNVTLTRNNNTNYIIDTSTLELRKRTSGKASVVPSPTADQMNKFYSLGVSADLLERREFYREVENIFGTSLIASEARDDLNEGAFKHNITTKIKPSKGFEDNQEAIDQAGIFDQIWQETYKLLTKDWLTTEGKAFLTFGNSPIEIDATDYGTIAELTQLSPYAMQINSDYRLRFKPGQLNAYTQFDDLAKTWLCDFPEALIVWPMTKEFAWHRYGLTRLFAALAAARALVRGEETLADSRDAAKLRAYIRVEDLTGGNVRNDEIDLLFENTREARIARGEDVNPNQTDVFNGNVKEVGMIQPNTSFFNDLNDIYYRASCVAKRFGSHILRLIPVDKNPARAVLDKIDGIAYVAQQQHRDHMLSLVCDPLIERQVAWYNGIMSNYTTFYKYSTNSSHIDLNKITMEIVAENDEPTDVLVEKAKTIVTAKGALIQTVDWESGIETFAKLQGRDPSVVRSNLIKERRAPQYILDEEDRKNGIVPMSQSAMNPQVKPQLRVV